MKNSHNLTGLLAESLVWLLLLAKDCWKSCFVGKTPTLYVFYRHHLRQDKNTFNARVLANVSEFFHHLVLQAAFPFPLPFQGCACGAVLGAASAWPSSSHSSSSASAQRWRHCGGAVWDLCGAWASALQSGAAWPRVAAGSWPAVVWAARVGAAVLAAWLAGRWCGAVLCQWAVRRQLRARDRTTSSLPRPAPTLAVRCVALRGF